MRLLSFDASIWQDLKPNLKKAMNNHSIIIVKLGFIECFSPVKRHKILNNLPLRKVSHSMFLSLNAVSVVPLIDMVSPFVAKRSRIEMDKTIPFKEASSMKLAGLLIFMHFTDT